MSRQTVSFSFLAPLAALALTMTAVWFLVGSSDADEHSLFVTTRGEVVADEAAVIDLLSQPEPPYGELGTTAADAAAISTAATRDVERRIAEVVLAEIAAAEAAAEEAAAAEERQREEAEREAEVVTAEETTTETTPAATTPPPPPSSGCADRWCSTGAVNGYPCGGQLPTCQVLSCESGGNPGAQNSHSTASGLWQFLDSSWGGYGGYARAYLAPWDVQNDRAAAFWAGGSGSGHWVSCL